MENIEKRLDLLLRIGPFRIMGLILLLFCFLSYHLAGQVTTEKIVSTAEELGKIELSSVTVVKFEPKRASYLYNLADSSGTANPLQLSTPEVSQPEYGFIKSEFVKVFPEAVNTDEKGEQNIDYYKLIPILYRIIQDQNTRIKTLENKVVELQNRIK